MIKNYLKIAWRNLFRSKFFSAINILGLALGMACSILILLWVQNELSIDAFHLNGASLYAVYERQYADHKVEAFYSTPGILGDEIKKVIPEVKYAVGVCDDGEKTFRVRDKILKIDGESAGPDLFKMFSYQLLQGNERNALNTPASIAISRKMAEDFFGSPTLAMGKTIRYENRKNFTVSAVFENLPGNVSQKFDYVINWDAFLQDNDYYKGWDAYGPQTYIMLRADADPALVNRKIKNFLDSYDKDQTAGFKKQLGIQKYGDVYLHYDFNDGVPSGGRIEYVNLFTIVAVFILLIACINFMNLTTARSVKRAREIGVRKVVGAMRSSLIQQFIGEAILITTIAVILSIVIVGALLPVFNEITQKQILFPFDKGYFWLALFALTLITGFISGIYPALVLSSFNPVKVLKGSVKLSVSSAWFKKGLVVFQFVLSVILIIGTIVISKQVNYIQQKNLGYDRENLVYIPVEGDLVSKYEPFKQEALTMPGIRQVSRVTSSPTDFQMETSGATWDGKDPNNKVVFKMVFVGYDFTNTMKLKMQTGRDFSRDFASDSLAYIVNETALKKLGYADPIGKPLTVYGKKGVIIGVLKDFHFASLHDPIEPLIVSLRENAAWGNILVRTQPGQTKQAISTIEKLCKELNPNFTVSYSFSDEEYQKLYASEKIVGKLANAFASLAIFISCMGLLGLAMFTIEQRAKEISIRKVLGASVTSLFTLLSTEFLLLVIIALLIASPIAWYAMNRWLMSFAYHTPVQLWVFVLAGIIAILVTLITVSFQSVKAALMNPIKSLRSE